MRWRLTTNAAHPRRAAAATELAVILPLFVFLFVFAVDFGRVFYHKYVVVNAARCGALYGSTNPTCAQDKAGIEKKARAEATDLNPVLLQVVSATGIDSAGQPCVDVTVNYSFKMITSYLIATNLDVACRIRMPVAPMLPTFH